MNSFDAAVEDSRYAKVDALDLYSYNMALAAAFLGPLHILEVVARNAMHSELSAYAKTPTWWDSGRTRVVEFQQQSVTEAEDKLDRDLTHRTRTPDDVVAALDFGFWCGLLGKGNDDLKYERTLWQPVLQNAFPHYRGDRGDLWKRMNAARKFRNRVTHHEPIHSFDPMSQTREILGSPD